MKRMKTVPMPQQSYSKSVMMMKLASGLIYLVAGVLLLMGYLSVASAVAIYLVVKGLKKMFFSCC